MRHPPNDLSSLAALRAAARDGLCLRIDMNQLSHADTDLSTTKYGIRPWACYTYSMGRAIKVGCKPWTVA